MQLDDLDFADDLALPSHTHRQMQMKTASIVAASAAVDLNIHKEKPTSSNITHGTPTLTISRTTTTIIENVQLFLNNFPRQILNVR
ncbi:unnamed protein product [Schistosoma margrebowiei]|uniref:Uncharacterized protein n=1 Tax=Schistosoma margrebowiei TaxID=48269 RepID=A0A183MRE0_9TREM|nr:unnamed protein product [Schistosoma margrebowiei]